MKGTERDGTETADGASRVQVCLEGGYGQPQLQGSMWRAQLLRSMPICAHSTVTARVFNGASPSECSQGRHDRPDSPVFCVLEASDWRSVAV